MRFQRRILFSYNFSSIWVINSFEQLLQNSSHLAIEHRFRENSIVIRTVIILSPQWIAWCISNRSKNSFQKSFISCSFLLPKKSKLCILPFLEKEKDNESNQNYYINFLVAYILRWYIISNRCIGYNRLSKIGMYFHSFVVHSIRYRFGWYPIIFQIFPSIEKKSCDHHPLARFAPLANS